MISGVNGFWLRSILKCSLIDNKKNYLHRGKYEQDALVASSNIIGRTTWDKACAHFIAPESRYYFCNENLRSVFYDGSQWEYEKCNKYQIAISQAGYPIKGLHKVIEAVALLCNEFPDIKVKVGGANIFGGNWIKGNSYGIVDNTHEAIIPAEQFELVRWILETETRRPNDAETVALFAGFLYCGDCGSRLVRRSASYKGKRYIYYQCSGSKQNKGSCTSHNLRDEKLYNIVRNALQMQIQIVMGEAEFVESIRQAQQEPYRVRRIERQIRQLTAEKAHTQGIKEKLYGDYADEILTREDFLNYNELYSKRIEEYDRKITELEAERQNLQTAPNAYPFLDVYRKYRKLEEITRPMVVELIEKIEVYEGNRVEIMFRFQDEIADLLEELHQKQHEVSA